MFFRRQETILHSDRQVKRFYQFIKQGKLTGIKKMAKAGFEVAEDYMCGGTALYTAYECGQLGIADYLLSKGARVRMLEAIKVDSLPLLQQVWDPCEVDRFDPPTSEAARLGHDTVLEWLIQNGGDIEALDTQDCTPLTTALAMGRVSTVRLLLQYGANPNYRDDEWVAFWSCLFPGRHDETFEKEPITLFEMVLAAGADVHLRAGNGITCLMIASEYSPEIVRRLLAMGVDIHCRNDRGKTALHYAVRGGCYEAVLELLQAGIDPNVTSHEGKTALDEALDGNWLDEEDELIKLLRAYQPQAEPVKN